MEDCILKDMKKIILFLLLSLAIAPATFAQEAAFTKAVARYKNTKTATAATTMIKHNAALTHNSTGKGTLYMKDPNKVAIVVNKGKDQLVMNGDKFTMVMNGRKMVASSKVSAQFAPFKAVLQSVLSGGSINVSKQPGTTVTTSGYKVIVTMKPTAANAKAARRMMFKSFELVINKNTGALISLTMNDRRGGYTQYQFSGFKYGAAVSDKVFNP